MEFSFWFHVLCTILFKSCNNCKFQCPWRWCDVPNVSNCNLTQCSDLWCSVVLTLLAVKEQVCLCERYQSVIKQICNLTNKNRGRYKLTPACICSIKKSNLIINSIAIALLKVLQVMSGKRQCHLCIEVLTLQPLQMNKGESQEYMLQEQYCTLKCFWHLQMLLPALLKWANVTDLECYKFEKDFKLVVIMKPNVLSQWIYFVFTSFRN